MFQRTVLSEVALDRFLRSRLMNDEIHEERSALSPVKKHNYNDCSYFVNVAKENYCLQNYKNMLKDSFFSQKNKDFYKNKNRKPNGVPEIRDWQVIARGKPSMNSLPFSILDMPDLGDSYLKNVIDWGSTDYIVTTYFGRIYFWNPTLKKGFKFKELKVMDCVKWNRAGTRLGMSIEKGKIAIFHCEKREIMHISVNCPCATNECSIICMDWTSTNHVITGCSKGTLTHWSSTLKVLKFNRSAHCKEIIKLALSCKETYLASSGTDHYVKVWNLKFELIWDMRFEVPTKAVSWHPWENYLLAIGEIVCFNILNVQSMEILESVAFIYHIIYNLLFNPNSGELLVSMYNEKKKVSYLKIFKNLDVAVDDIRCNQDRIPYLMWDRTGTKLGTASTDENFGIWCFFGKSTELEKRYLKTKRKIYSTKNIISTVNAFGKTIR